jgi:clorobiocin biosynthesis protein CloN7
MSLSTAAPSRSRLYYERRGSGPLLLLIGSPMDSGGFAPLASALADRYTVVTYDPRGIANSSREDTSRGCDARPAGRGPPPAAVGARRRPADVLGSSGGALVGLALVTAHPDQLRTLVAHEPPLVELLADAARLRAEIQNIYDTYRVEGAEKAMQKFPGLCRLRRGARPGGGRPAVRAVSGAAGPDAGHHRPVPGASAAPDHPLPARHRSSSAASSTRC